MTAVICAKCGYENVPTSLLCNLCQEPLLRPGAPPPLTAQQKLEIEMQKALAERPDGEIRKAVLTGLGAVIGVFSVGLIALGIRAVVKVPGGKMPGLAMICFAFGLLSVFLMYLHKRTKV